MKTIEQIAADILVSCGYADRIANKHGVVGVHVTGSPKSHRQDVDLFYSGDPVYECYARRQADAIEDWLVLNGWHREMWTPIAPVKTGSSHLERISRIKHCLEQLISERTAKTAPQTD